MTFFSIIFSLNLVTDGKFQFVPKPIFDDAEKYAKEAMESDDEEM